MERKIVVFRDGGAALGSQQRGRARRFDASLLGKPIQCRAAQAKPSQAHPTLRRGLGKRRSGQTGFRAKIRIHAGCQALVGRAEARGCLTDWLLLQGALFSTPWGEARAGMGLGKQFSSVGQ